MTNTKMQPFAAKWRPRPFPRLGRHSSTRRSSMAGQGSSWSNSSLDNLGQLPPAAQAALANMTQLCLGGFVGTVCGEYAPAPPAASSRQMQQALSGARRPLAQLNPRNVARKVQPALTCTICGGGPFKNLRLHMTRSDKCRAKAAEDEEDKAAEDEEDMADACTDPEHRARRQCQRCVCATCVDHWAKVDSSGAGEGATNCATVLCVAGLLLGILGA